MSQTNYLKQAWADLKQGRGWCIPLLLLGLVSCIPVAGPVVSAGYLLDWAKEAAWGMDRGLPRRVGSIGRRFRYGFIALAIYLVWTVPMLVLSTLLSQIPGVGSILNVVCTVAMLVFSTLGTVAVLRGLVYERVEPGLHFARVFKMANHDMPGLLVVFCGLAATWLLSQLVEFFVALVLGNTMQLFLPAASGLSSSIGLLVMVGAFSSFLIFLIYLAGCMLTTMLMAVALRVLGLWFAQFEPAKWGASKEEMPFEREDGAAAREEARQAARPAVQGGPQQATQGGPQQGKPEDLRQEEQQAGQDGPRQAAQEGAQPAGCPPPQQRGPQTGD